jgi:hypothetical protein
MMLLPLLESTFKPKAMLPAAAPSLPMLQRVAAILSDQLPGQQPGEQVLGRWQQSLGTDCWATCTARSQLVRISIFSADHSIRFIARTGTGFLCLHRVDTAPFQNIPHQATWPVIRRRVDRENKPLQRQ